MQRLTSIVRHLQPQSQPQSQSRRQVRSEECAAEGPSAAVFAKHVRLSAEVASALREGRAIVALESTIISHGMPWPQNFETALRVEQTARDHGATPATIAILDGVICVGLERTQLEQLAQLGEACAKCSRRDLALLVARKAHGATTVATTMLVASWVGIPLFVTGGIGGVHRGAESSMDISADLSELGRTPVAVVCAGVKSILDIGRTLEVLETNGVAVASFGTDEFPAFFTPKSGFQSPSRVDTPEQAAGMVHASRRLGMQSGMVFAVPIPADQAAQAQPIEVATQRALKEANEQGVRGRDITPFLLGRIAELTKGESLGSNIALVINNVKIGSAIAVEIARMAKEDVVAGAAAPAAFAPTPSVASGSVQPGLRWPATLSGPLVIGGANLDLLGRPAPNTKFLLGTSNPGKLARSWGGVGRNMAEVLGRLGAKPHLLAAVGSDGDGRNLVEYARNAGVQTEGSIVISSLNGTSTYMAILDEKGDLFTTIADMDICEELVPQSHLPPHASLSTAPLVLIDGNVTEQFIVATAALCSSLQVPLMFEPTSIEKCTRAMGPLLDNQVTFVTPSAAELLCMFQRVMDLEKKQSGETAEKQQQGGFLNHARDTFEHNKSTQAVEAQCGAILGAIARRAMEARRPLKPVHIILKRGSSGAMIASLIPGQGDGVHIAHLPAGRLPSGGLVNTSGAGDSLVGATAWSLLHQSGSSNPRAAARGEDHAALIQAVAFGMRAAEMTLCAAQSVSPLLSPQALRERQALHQQQKQ